MLSTAQIQYPSPKKSREVILIAEDYADTRTYVSACLSEHYEVIEASSGDEAWQLTLALVPDLIISDLHVPGMSGIDLCRKVKQDERTDFIPFVILTGQIDVNAKIEGLNGGADDYIAKPFYVQELQARVHNLIETRKRIQLRYARPLWLDRDDDVQSADEKFLQRVTKVIKDNIDNNQFGVEMFAREVGLSTVQLYRKLHSLTGKSPNDFIRDIRLMHSAWLLKKRVGNVSEVAYQVGFSTLSYFSKCFREKFGCTPNAYIKSFPITSCQSKVA